MKSRVNFKDCVNDCLCKQFFCVSLLPDPFKRNFVDNFSNSKACYGVLAENESNSIARKRQIGLTLELFFQSFH